MKVIKCFKKQMNESYLQNLKDPVYWQHQVDYQLEHFGRVGAGLIQDLDENGFYLNVDNKVTKKLHKDTNESVIRYPNGMKVTDIDLYKALDYQYGTDRDKDNSKYADGDDSLNESISKSDRDIIIDVVEGRECKVEDSRLQESGHIIPKEFKRKVLIIEDEASIECVLSTVVNTTSNTLNGGSEVRSVGFRVITDSIPSSFGIYFFDEDKQKEFYESVPKKFDSIKQFIDYLVDIYNSYPRTSATYNISNIAKDLGYNDKTETIEECVHSEIEEGAEEKAVAQRKAMFANGFGESLEDDLKSDEVDELDKRIEEIGLELDKLLDDENYDRAEFDKLACIQADMIRERRSLKR